MELDLNARLKKLTLPGGGTVVRLDQRRHRYASSLQPCTAAQMTLSHVINCSCGNSGVVSVPSEC